MGFSTGPELDQEEKTFTYGPQHHILNTVRVKFNEVAQTSQLVS